MIPVDLSDTLEYHLAVFFAPVFEYKVVATSFVFAFRMHFRLIVLSYLLQVKTGVFTKPFVPFVDLSLQTFDAFPCKLG